MKIKGKIGIIGLGNMGNAIAKGLLKNKLVPASCIIGFDTDAKKATKLKMSGIRIAGENINLVRCSDIVILAVKPQEIKDLLAEIRPLIDKKKLIISILAGVKTAYLEKFAGKAKVVRVMPNIAITIGEGVCAISKGKYASFSDAKIAEKVFAAMGKTFILKESLMDSVTAISGSGPAYFFEIVDYIARAAKKLGLPRNIADKLVIQTAKGAIGMLENNPNPSFLTSTVTSKKGTTIEALKLIRKNRIDKIFLKAVSAAKRRAGQLSPS